MMELPPGIFGAGMRIGHSTRLMPRRLPAQNPVRGNSTVVAQRVVAAAEVLPAQIGGRIAIQGVIRVIDRSGVDAGILQECEDERLTGDDVVCELR